MFLFLLPFLAFPEILSKSCLAEILSRQNLVSSCFSISCLFFTFFFFGFLCFFPPVFPCFSCFFVVEKICFLSHLFSHLRPFLVSNSVLFPISRPFLVSNSILFPISRSISCLVSSCLVFKKWSRPPLMCSGLSRTYRRKIFSLL